MPEILEKLFNSKTRIKIFRLFLNNPEQGYLLREVAERLKVNLSDTRREIKSLGQIKFLILRKKSGKVYYYVNGGFVFYDELKKLIFKASPSSSGKIKSRVAKLGQVRFVLISGSLINSDKGRVDIMIVGEHINRNKLKRFLSDVEAEVGKAVNYVYMSTDEFKYRQGMFDKFVVDVLEGPGKILIDKLKTNT